MTTGPPYDHRVTRPGLRLPAAAEREPEYGHDALVVCDNLVRIYQSEGIEVQALQGLDLLVHAGRDDRGRRGLRVRQVHAAAGAGRGRRADGRPGPGGRARPARAVTRAERVRYRRHVVGFVRQQTARNLVALPERRQVVDLPMTIAGTPASRARRAGR